MIQEPPLVVLLGLPFHDITMEEVLEDAREMLKGDTPRYFVTANVDFTTQADADADLRKIVFFADRVVCDGMPLVWLSKIFGRSLRERVAGSDMVPRLFDICARDGHSVYFFGSDIRTLEEAAKIVAERYPGLVVAGCDAPPVGAVIEWDNDTIGARMRASGAKLLLVCLGCPKQERWIFANHLETGIPLSIGVGASLDFITGKQVRAPGWMQKTGLEWFWRMAGNPKRLISRYAHDLSFLAKASIRQASLGIKRDRIQHEAVPVSPVSPDFLRLSWTGAIEKGLVTGAPILEVIDRAVLLNLSGITFMDSGGLGRLAALLRSCRTDKVDLILVSPSPFVRKALAAARMEALFSIADDEAAAIAKLSSNATTAVTSSVNDGVVKVSFNYSLDAVNLAKATAVLDEGEAAATKTLVIDLAGVDFIDSRAVGALIRVHKRMVAKGGALRLYRPQPGVKEIIRLLRLDQILSEWKEGA